MLDPLQFKQPLKLDIGAGNYSSDSSFTAVDAFTVCDIKAFMWDIPLPDNCVDAIFSSNALEHISKFAIIPTLKEWHRLLKPGGRMQIIVPDLEWIVKFWFKMRDTKWATGWPMDIIYGNQLHEGEYHKTGFTQKILWDYLTISANGGWFVHTIYYMEGDDNVPEGLEVELDKIQDHVAQRMIVVEAEKVDPDKEYPVTIGV